MDQITGDRPSKLSLFRASPTRQCLDGKPQGIARYVALPFSCDFPFTPPAFFISIF